MTESPNTEGKEKGKEMNCTETKHTENQKRTAATPETFAESFTEAMRTHEKALKSAVQLQEESVKLWKDVLTKLGSSEEFQAKLAILEARKRMEECVETFNRASNQMLDLIERTLSAYRATWVSEAQRRVQQLLPRFADVLQSSSVKRR
jgi:hypothetical protein